MPDRVKCLREIEGEDMHEIILSQHCANDVQHRHKKTGEKL